MPDRPHILIFNPDQWRGDVVGHMGNPAAVTPRLDAFAANEGVSFRNAFCQNPVCTPSRCSFMTGWYPHVRGHRTMYHMLQPHEPLLLEQLRRAGYFVWWGGKNDLVPAQLGYDRACDVKYAPSREPRPMWAYDRQDEWRGRPGDPLYRSMYGGRLDTGGEDIYYDEDWADVLGAVEFIRNAPADRPLCIYLPLTYPHPPYAVEDPWYSMIDREALPPRTPTVTDWSGKPDILSAIARGQKLQGVAEQQWTELRAVYYGMCARVDHQFGLVVDALKEAGLYDDTAAFFFADHGDFTGDYGLVEKTQNTFEDCLTRVPFLIKPPQGTAVRPRVSDAMVELVDLSATVYDLCGIEPDYTHFGRSLRGLLSGESDELRDAVFCEGGRLTGEHHCMELSSNQDPKGFYWPRLAAQQSENGEHSKAVMCRTRDFKYVHRLYESDELYDLRSDPRELENRIDDSALAGAAAEMKDRLLQFFLATGDVVPHQPDRRS